MAKTYTSSDWKLAGVVFLIALPLMYFFVKPDTPEERKAEAARPKSESELKRACAYLHSDLGFIARNRRIMLYPDDTYGDDVFIVVLNGKIDGGRLDFRNCVIRKDGTIIDHNG